MNLGTFTPWWPGKLRHQEAPKLKESLRGPSLLFNLALFFILYRAHVCKIKLVYEEAARVGALCGFGSEDRFAQPPGTGVNRKN